MPVTTRATWRTSTLALGPTDRPLSKWRRWRKKLRQWRGFIFWSPIIIVLLYGFVIEPLRLVERKTRPVISDWPYHIGHIVEGGRHLFVTPGIGTSICPVRFGVPPEISILTINTKEKN